jgi:hypothetical protein
MIQVNDPTEHVTDPRNALSLQNSLISLPFLHLGMRRRSVRYILCLSMLAAEQAEHWGIGMSMLLILLLTHLSMILCSVFHHPLGIQVDLQLNIYICRSEPLASSISSPHPGFPHLLSNPRELTIQSSHVNIVHGSQINPFGECTGEHFSSMFCNQRSVISHSKSTTLRRRTPSPHLDQHS